MSGTGQMLTIRIAWIAERNYRAMKGLRRNRRCYESRSWYHKTRLR